MLRIKGNLRNVNMAELNLHTGLHCFCGNKVCAPIFACFGPHAINYIVGEESLVDMYQADLLK